MCTVYNIILDLTRMALFLCMKDRKLPFQSLKQKMKPTALIDGSVYFSNECLSAFSSFWRSNEQKAWRHSFTIVRFCFGISILQFGFDKATTRRGAKGRVGRKGSRGVFTHWVIKRFDWQHSAKRLKDALWLASAPFTITSCALVSETHISWAPNSAETTRSRGGQHGRGPYRSGSLFANLRCRSGFLSEVSPLFQVREKSQWGLLLGQLLGRSAWLWPWRSWQRAQPPSTSI